MEDYCKAIELDPKEAGAFNNRGTRKSDLGRHEAAMEDCDYDKAIELDPKYAEAFNKRGYCKNALGRHEAAIEDYDKAIELNPNGANCFLNRFAAQIALGECDAALEDCKRAMELYPGKAWIRFGDELKAILRSFQGIQLQILQEDNHVDAGRCLKTGWQLQLTATVLHCQVFNYHVRLPATPPSALLIPGFMWIRCVLAAFSRMHISPCWQKMRRTCYLLASCSRVPRSSRPMVASLKWPTHLSNIKWIPSFSSRPVLHAWW